MTKAIPLSIPSINGNEWKYIKECLDSGWVSSVGGYVGKFESIVAGYLGVKYAVATTSGTAALHLSLLACGIGRGDEVIVPALTFIAPVNAVRYCGAEPVFVDCDKKTLCMDVEKVEAFFKEHTIRSKAGSCINRKTKKRIKAIIPVHIFGHPVQMRRLVKVCKKFSIKIIEDAAESLGSSCSGGKTGTFGTLGCLSFNGNKIVTTGGGGMVVTNDAALAGRIRHLATQAKRDELEYDHDEIGYNYRLSNIQSAMGVAQLEMLKSHIDIKRKNAVLYRDLLSSIDDVSFLWEMPWARSNFWLYTIRVPKKDKQPLLGHLLSHGIQVRPIWRLINTLPMYRRCQANDVIAAKEAHGTCLNLPSSVGIKERDIAYVADAVKGYFKL